MTHSLAILAGIFGAAGVVCLVAAFGRSAPQLGAALDRVGGQTGTQRAGVEAGPAGRPSERLGAYLYRITPVPLSDRQRQALRLQDKSVAEFYADKAVMAAVGALFPGVLGFAYGVLNDRLSVAPAAFAGTMSVFFAALNLSKVVPYAALGLIDMRNLGTSLVLAPLAPLGVWAGVWLTRRVNPGWFYRLAYGGMFLTGCKLLWHGLHG